MKIDILKAYLKYKFGLAAGLPAFVINSVKECDNGEPLVDIKKSGLQLFFGGRLTKKNKFFYAKLLQTKS